MDIDFLLMLQDFRNGAGSILAEFLSKMTFLAELNTSLVVMAIVYWCVSKGFGTYLLMGWSANRLVNGVLKVTVCAYRPWIRDARIVPFGNALTTATGYSFPSGHTMIGATLFGGVAVRKDMPKLLRIVMGAIVALVAFSRVYLGVHTPQDIIVGTVAGLLVMRLVFRLTQWLEAHPDKDMLVACIGIGLAVAVATYALVKPYPMDYDSEGKLLVDGAKMANDTIKGVGWAIAFLIGWILERRFVGFSTEVPLITRVTRLSIGLLGYYVLSLILVPLVKAWILGAAGLFVTCFFQMLYISFLFPWCMKRLEAAHAAEEGDALPTSPFPG